MTPYQATPLSPNPPHSSSFELYLSYIKRDHPHKNEDRQSLILSLETTTQKTTQTHSFILNLKDFKKRDTLKLCFNQLEKDMNVHYQLAHYCTPHRAFHDQMSLAPSIKLVKVIAQGHFLNADTGFKRELHTSLTYDPRLQSIHIPYPLALIEIPKDQNVTIHYG